MPFTPFHFGPTLMLGLLLRRISLPAILIGSVIADGEGFSVLFLGLDYPLHGYAHTFLGASIIAILLIIVLYLLRSPMEKVMDFVRLPQQVTWPGLAIGSFIGTFSHVILDSFLYTDIKPFYPSNYNPFYAFISSPFVYKTCTLLFVGGIIIYVILLIKKK